jgi:hypothetical protein
MKSLRNRPLLNLSLLSVACLIIFAGYSASRFIPRAGAASFTVINTNDSGAGSLRQAISDANGSAGLDTINFAIPGAGVQTIALASALPVITDPVIINGYSQTGSSVNTQADTDNAVLLIEINGAGAGANPCLQISAGGSTVRGLVINRCGADGILLQTAGTNIVEGNFIGIDPTGTIIRSNTFSGVSITVGSTNNTIGGTTPAARNVVSGNLLHGITIPSPSATGNLVAGNFVGTNAAGTAALSNSFQGVFLSSANNTVGGTTVGARNVVSGNNGGSGVTMGSGGNSNIVQGNYIGLNALGTSGIPNGSGVFTLDGASNNLIGGTAAGARNVISGNSIGLSLATQNTSVNNRVEGNLIGTDPAGTAPVPNGYGVRIGLLGVGNKIGGTAAGAGNVIAFNTAQGVVVESKASANSILANSIFSNGALGIDLASEGVTPNDPLDADTVGGNNRQNYPVLTSAASAGGNTTIGGTLHSTANTSFRIEFFTNTAIDASGFGEGRTFIGSTGVTTDGSGNASFSVLTGSATPTGQFITATATNNVTEETSEFSYAAQVNGAEAIQFASPTFTFSENAGTATITVTRTNGVAAGTTVNYATSAGTAAAIVDYTTSSGTLTFGIGELSKTFTVPLNDDAQIEGDETFTVSLSSPSLGAVLGAPNTATVIIADREQTIYGVTAFNNLVSFERANPATVYSKVSFTGLQANEQILGIDFRPSNAQLYGLGSTSRLYTINPVTGAATQVGAGQFTPLLSGADFGFDFDPVTDKIRVVSGSDQNLRIDPDTVVATTDTPVAFDPTDPNVAVNPSVHGLAYTNNVAGSLSTTLYGIDSNLDRLVRIGSTGGSPTSPNSGLLFTVGALGVDTSGFTGFDIPSSGNTALAVLAPPNFVPTNSSNLYTIDLTTGATTEIGYVGLFTLAETIRAIATVTNGGIGLSSAAVNVAEGAGKVQLTLNRTGDVSGAASVEFASSDGTAVQTSDYNIAFGTVNFAPGETSRTFDVFITNDGFVEPNENFTVTISNPKAGFQLGGTQTVTVTITDNDPVPSATNPLDDTTFFVRQHYVEFLNREPDGPGLAFWTNIINSCGANAQCLEVARINVSASFFLSIEFQKSGGLVYLTHKAMVGNNFPGPGQVPVLYTQFEHDTQTIQQGLVFGQPDFDATLEKNKSAFFADFVSRPEFSVAFPATQTPTQFVDAMIANTGVAFTAAERNAAINEFGNASTSAANSARARALRLIAEDTTFVAAEFNRTFVALEYFGYLRRHPDAPGFTFWLDKLNLFNGNYITSEMVKAFLSSIEYRQRFAAN